MMHVKCLAPCLEQSEALNIQAFYHMPSVTLCLLSSEVWEAVTQVCQTAQVAHLSRSPQGSSSSDSLEGQSCDYASKSYDAVVFDVLKVTPEEFAVSNKTDVGAGPTIGC